MKNYIPLSEFIAEIRKDPELAEAMDEAKAEMEQMKKELGDDAYYDWLLGHTVGVEL